MISYAQHGDGPLRPVWPEQCAANVKVFNTVGAGHWLIEQAGPTFSTLTSPWPPEGRSRLHSGVTISGGNRNEEMVNRSSRGL